MQCTFTARCLNSDKDKITKTWIKIVIMQCTVPVHTKRCLNKDKDKISKTWCYNAKYVQQSFSVPTHPKHGSNEITIQGIHSVVKTTLRRCTYNPRTKQYYKNHIDGIIVL